MCHVRSTKQYREHVAKVAYKQIPLLLSPNFSLWEQKFHRSEIFREETFLEQSLLRSECSIGAKVPWAWAEVLSVDFLLPGMKVQRNEKSRYLNLVLLRWSTSHRHRNRNYFQHRVTPKSRCLWLAFNDYLKELEPFLPRTTRAIKPEVMTLSLPSK